MRCLIAGYNLVGALQGRAQNIATLQVGGIVAVDAIDAIVAIDAIDAIEAIEDGLGGMWAWGDGRKQKVGFAEKKTAPVGVGMGGCVGVSIEGRAQNIAPLQVGG